MERSYSSLRNLRPSPLFLLVLWIFAQSPNALASSARRSPVESSLQQQSAAAQSTQETTPLELGKPVERELSGGQKHIYQLALTEGQYANLTIEQRGIDVSVRLSGADGKLIAEFDSESRNQGPENIEFVAAAAGTYKLEVTPTAKGASANRYEVRLSEARAATERDRSLFEALKFFAEAASLYRAMKYADALLPAERAAQIFEQTLGAQSQDFARALNYVAHVHLANKDYAKAEPLYLRALEIRERVSGAQHPDVAASCHAIANFYNTQREAAKAKPFIQRALTIREKLLDSNHLHTGQTLFSYASILFNLQEYAPAEELYLRAISVLEKAVGDDEPRFSAALHGLGYLYDTTGDFIKAEQIYQRELASREKAKGKDSLEAAYALNYIARTHFLQGDYDKAEAFYQRTFDIYRNKNDESGTLIALGNLALIHHARGDYERAETVYKQLVERREKAATPNQGQIAHDLLNLGVINNDKGDYASAEQYLTRSLAIVEAILKGTLLERMQANIFSGLAFTNIGKGDYATAEQLCRRALTIYEKIYGPNHLYIAVVLRYLGRIAYLKGELAGAVPFYRRALAISEKSQGVNNPNLPDTLKSLADIYAARGETAQALEFQGRANVLGEYHLTLSLATGSERQKLIYLAASASNINRNVTFNLRYAPTDHRAAEMALTTVLRRKGRVLDAMTDTL
ncbi:MAG: tetratricopeptide repeat protein, partial [Acidobacteria bacterium]|nr:tetratricopeptide repeat protein [Acidobacteriota bacterium]